MYDRSAAYYDLIYRDLKDYREESSKIDALLQSLAPQPKRLLDVGCGTAEHARRLVREHGYHVDGIDIQTEFVKIARAKLPQSRFEVADMRDFHLGQKYDALLCLFSSIGYVETIEGLGKTLCCFAAHIKPRGWLICEPWITPDAWHAGQFDSVSATDSLTGDTIVRTRVGETDGSVSVLKIDYDIHGEAGSSHFSETHRLGLFEEEQMRSELLKAGFVPKALSMGPETQSLLVAQRND